MWENMKTWFSFLTSKGTDYKEKLCNEEFSIYINNIGINEFILYNIILFCVVSFGSTLPLEMIPVSEEQYSVAAGQIINISSSKLLFEASWYAGDK
jgi:hypothetical protein